MLSERRHSQTYQVYNTLLKSLSMLNVDVAIVPSREPKVAKIGDSLSAVACELYTGEQHGNAYGWRCPTVAVVHDNGSPLPPTKVAEHKDERKFRRESPTCILHQTCRTRATDASRRLQSID